MKIDRKTVILGTKNQDKLRELQRLLAGSGIRAVSLRDFPKRKEVVEDGRTFEENARKKARIYSKHSKGLVLADDSGLMVSYLKGKPGVYSARFAGPGCNYRDNNRKLLRLLKTISGPKRAAKFVCVIALCDKGRFVGVVRGDCRGRIAPAEKGKNGFGYDPVFIPNGFSKTYAELSPKTKNRISHRGQALRKAKRLLHDRLK